MLCLEGLCLAAFSLALLFPGYLARPEAVEIVAMVTEWVWLVTDLRSGSSYPLRRTLPSQMSRRKPLHEEGESLVESDSYEDQHLAAPEGVSIAVERPFNPLSWLALPWHLAMVVFYCLLLRESTIVMSTDGFREALNSRGKVPEVGGRFKFLTHINVSLQFGFFAVQLLADLSPGPFKKVLQRLTDLVFTTMVLPLAIFIPVSFWGLYAIDRNLIYPEVFDKVVPPYINHFLHTAILLWALCEVYLVHHHFPSTRWAAVVIFTYSLAYCSWVVYLYVTTNWWCYSVMHRIGSLYAMVPFFACSIFLCFGLHLLGRWVAGVRWGRTTHLDGY